MKRIYLILFLITTLKQINAQNKTIELIKNLSIEKFNYFNPNDAQRLNEILDDDVIFIHSNGMTENKEEMIKNLIEKKWGVEKVDVLESSVRMLNKKAAVLIGKGIYYVKLKDELLEMELYYTEVWKKNRSGWKLYSRHANKMK